MDVKIYCTYHDPKLIDEYNLKETENFKLFYTKSDLSGYSINYTELYLNEFVTQYYIWKNQIKSEYVGFCHYRRNFLNSINDSILKQLDKEGVYTFNYSDLRFGKNIKEELLLGGLNNHIDLLKEYINIYYPNNKNQIVNILINCNKISFGELYIAKWDIFNQLMEFINNYIIFIFNRLLNINHNELYEYTLQDYDKLALYLNNTNWNLYKEEHIKNNTWNDDNPPPFYGGKRSIGFMIEMFEGIFWELNKLTNV